MSSISPSCAPCRRAKFSEAITPFPRPPAGTFRPSSPSTAGSSRCFAIEPISTATIMIGRILHHTRTLRTDLHFGHAVNRAQASASDAGNTKLRADNVSAVVTKKSGLSAMRIHSVIES